MPRMGWRTGSVYLLALGISILLSSTATHAADRYWVATSPGNWSDSANWSDTQGGAGGATAPTNLDVAHFTGDATGDCTLNVNVSALGIDVDSAFTGAIFQSNGVSLTVGSSGLTLAGGTFVGGDSTIDANGSVTLGSAFTSTSGTFSCTGSLAITGAFVNNGGTVIFDGGSPTFTPNAAVFNNLTFDVAGNLTVTGTANVEGTFWCKRANTVNSGTVAVQGNVITTATGLSGASGTVLFNGTGDQVLSANGGTGKLPNIVVNKSAGTVFVEDTIQIKGSFTEISGAVDTTLATIEFISVTLSINAPTTVFENLVFNTSGYVTIVGTAHAHNFTNAQSNNIGVGTVEVTGNVVTTSQSYSGAGGILLLNGTGDQSISAGGGSGKIPSVVVDKPSGNFSVQDSIKVGGDWTFLFADAADAGSSTVEFFGGTTTVYAGSMSFNDVIVNKSGTLNVSGDMRVADLSIVNVNTLNGDVIHVTGDLTTTDSTLAGASATILLDGASDQTISASGGVGSLPSMEFNKSGGTVILADVLQVNGGWNQVAATVNPGTSTVSFISIGTKTIQGDAVFNNLELNRSFLGEKVEIQGDVSVLGALDVNKGTLAILEDSTLSVGGDLSIDPTNGNLLANASTVVLNGTGAQAADFGGRTVNNLTVSNAGGTVSFTTGIETAEGSTVTFDAGSSIAFANAQTFSFDQIAWLGTAGNPVTLRSDAPGLPWFLEAAGYPSVTHVDVQDSDASGGETIIATNSTDSGNNTNWAFQGAGTLAITTPAASKTNPAWVEGTSGSDAVSLQIAVDAGDPFDAVRLNPTKWFGDDASAGGASLGVTISASQATHVEVTATDALSNVNSVSQDITWAETDLTGKYFSTDTVKIREGDSLLLTADGTGTALEIDGDGDGTYESSGAPGDAFPTLYGTAGTYVARAKIDGAEVGSLTVVVIGVDLHGPVACELNWQRIQDTYVTPVTEVASVAFESANPFALTASFNQNTTTGVRLNLKPLKMGTPQFLARLGSGGPIFGTQEVKVFILKNLNTAIAGVAMDENGFGEGAFRFQVVPPTVIANDDPQTPETEGLFFDFLVTGGFLTVAENGQSSIRVPSTAQDENGLFEIGVLYDPSGTSVCSRIHAVQVNSPDVDAGPEHHANPCITKVCKVVWFQEEVNDETSAADKARQQGNINAHSKRFHAHPPFVPQLEDGQDHTVMWSQGRKFVFVGEPVGSDYFAALISPPKRGPVEYDVMARCEREHCPRVPPCPQKDDDGTSSHRMVSLKANPKDEVRAEIFYPFLVNEQMVGKATPGPTTFPHGTYDLSPPNWVGYNPGPEPHIDDPQICGPVPCPHPIDTCKKPIPCFGCNEYLVKYVNHWGTFDVHIGPNGVCPKTDSPRIKDAITIIRLEAVGPKENEQKSGGFVGDPDGTVFPDEMLSLSQAEMVRIEASGGENAEIVQVTSPNDCGQSVVPANTRKGVIEKNTNSFTFDAVLDPDFEIPEGATLTYSWDFGDGDSAEGQSAFHSYETPGRYNVTLTLTIAVPESDPIVATAELHSINIIQEECDNERPHPGYLAEENRAGVQVRILARGPAGATVNVALHVRRRADIGQTGLGRVSLDGYPEDEYKNGFTPATSGANVEGLTQYYSMTIDGQEHFPPKNGSAGVDTKSLSDPEMVTWVIFLQGMGVSDIADNVDLIVFGREIRAMCEGEAPNCTCIYTQTDTESISAKEVAIQWINHEGKPVNTAFRNPEATDIPYYRMPGQPGGRGSFGGPPTSTGFDFYQDPFKFDSLSFNQPPAPALATITCNMVSNVSSTPTNALTATNSFILTQLSSTSRAYVADNGVLGLFLLDDPAPLPSGRKAFTAIVVNPIFGFKGERIFYEESVGSNTYMTRRFTIVASFDHEPDDSTIETATVSLNSDVPSLAGITTTGSVILVESGTDSNYFVNAEQSIEMYLTRFSPNDPSLPSDLTVQITCAGLDADRVYLDAIETSPGTNSYRTELLVNSGGPLSGASANAVLGNIYRIKTSPTAALGSPCSVQVNRGSDKTVEPTFVVKTSNTSFGRFIGGSRGIHFEFVESNSFGFDGLMRQPIEVLCQAGDTVTAIHTPSGATTTIAVKSIKIEWLDDFGIPVTEPNAYPKTKFNFGLRYFPDAVAASPNAPKNVMNVLVTVKPARANQAVWVKWFDVDDPVANNSPLDPNGSSGGDNRSDGNSGFVNYPTAPSGAKTNLGVTDIAGQVVFPIRVGMQPGNNYRVLAALDQDLLSNYENDAVHYTKQTTEGEGIFSELMTIWRKLHIEVDTMGPVTGNSVHTTITGIEYGDSHKVYVADTLYDGSDTLDHGGGNGRFSTGSIAAGNSSAFVYRNGDFFVDLELTALTPNYQAVLNDGGVVEEGTIHSLTFENLGSPPTPTTKIVVNNFVANVLEGSLRVTTEDGDIIEATILDSGIDAESELPAYRVSGHFAIPCTVTDDDLLQDGDLIPVPPTSTLVDHYGLAFIEPAFDVGDNNRMVPFLLPTSWDQLFENNDFDAANLLTSNFWVVYLLGAHSPLPRDDSDPIAEGSLILGVNGGEGRFGGQSIIFIESHNEVLLRDQDMSISAAHEIGHSFSLEDNSGGIMNHTNPADPTPVDPDTELPEFTDEQLNTIRSIEKPFGSD